ncbi:tripartite tricarboxylate transporter permease [Psychrilyobacter atlanticus]|uniref:tripartite tricarboxylate transporter permease n=1 Tax=Psychrilyobacter atlanticus TaxID=271091 RepID=UPI0004131DCC|nr:tripartite tricarboxylate transporter permease [Psychrilyobacter atlanticus]
MSEIIHGFLNAVMPINLLASLLSVAVGIMIGSLPGLSAAMGVALLIPLTFGMSTETGLIALAGVYCGAVFGGSISAILIHTPGTSSAAATALDGYQLTLKGKAKKALNTAVISSFGGAMMSAIALYMFAPPLAKLALKFGPAENFWLSIFGLTIIAGVSSKSVIKGLLSGAFGLALSTIGMDPMSGTARFTMDSIYLLDGLPFTATLIGLFSMSQVFILSEKKLKKSLRKLVDDGDEEGISLKELKMLLPTILRSGVIGSVVGILPGAGGTIAAFIGYDTAKKMSKNKDQFGKGCIEGVAGPEAANNAVTGGSLIPTLTLGIPGNSVTAVLMGGLIIKGLQPGPDLFTVHGKITYTFFAGFIVVNIFMLLLGLFASKHFAKISKVPNSVLIPIIFALSVIGSYAIKNSMFDVAIMFVFGIIGYFVKKFGLNAAAIVLALIIGPIGEEGLRRVTLMYPDNVMGQLFSSPISIVLITVSLLSLASPIVMGILERRSNR